MTDKIETLSHATKESIKIVISNFENFSMEKYGKVAIIPDLKEAKEEQVFDVLQAWINWNKSKSPTTVKLYFSHLRKYLHYMGVKLNDQDVKQELTFKHKIDEELYGLTVSDIQLILAEMRYKTKVQYLCQLSGLMRIGEVIQLRKKNLVLGKKNIIVKIPPTITKFSKGRTTFFSKEASRMLIPLLKEMDDNDIVFGSSDNPKFTDIKNKDNSISTTKQALRTAVKKADLEMTYESTGRYMINTHAFRSFGITKLSRHDPNFAKKLAGQKGYLLQYDRMTDEEKLNVYEKYESELTIDTTAKQKAEISQLKTDNDELQKLRDMIQDKDKVEKMFKQIKADELRLKELTSRAEAALTALKKANNL